VCCAEGGKAARRRWTTSAKAFTRLLGEFAAAAPGYMVALLDAGAASALRPTPQATSLVLSFLSQAGKLEPHKEILAGQFCSNLLTAKTRPTASVYTCFGPFLAELTLEELTSLILPTVPRAIKRGPTVVVLMLGWVAETLTCDTNAFLVETLMPFALEHIKGADERKSADALTLVRSIARCAEDPSTAGSLFAAAAAALKSCTDAEERRTLIHVASTLATECPAELSGCAAAAVDALIPLMRTEKAIDVKAEYTEPIGQWLFHMAEIPPSFVKFVETVLKNAKAEAVRRGLFMSILRAFDSDELVQQGAVFVPSALHILKACADKPSIASVRAREGVAIARILITMATVDSTVAADLEKGPFWKLLLAPDSQLGFWAAVTDQASRASLELLQETSILFEGIIRDHGSTLADMGTGDVVYDAFAMMLTHPSSAVRQTAAAATARLLNRSPQQSRLFLPAFSRMLFGLGDNWTLRGTSNGYVEFDDVDSTPAAQQFSDCIPSEILTRALRQVTQHLSVSDAATFLLSAHHPALMGSESGDVWHRFTSRCLKRRAANEPAFQAQLPKFCDLLLGDRGLSSALSTDRKAAQSAVRSLSRWNFEKFSAAFLPRLRDAMRFDEVEQLTEYDLNIFEGDDNHVVDPELSDIYAGLAVAKEKEKTEDEKWEEQLLKELQAKKGVQQSSKKGRGGGRGGGRGKGRGGPDKSRGMSAKEMMEGKAAVKLLEEKERRRALFALSDAVQESLSALSGMISSDPVGALCSIHELILPTVMPFIGARLPPISRCAVETLETIVLAVAQAPDGGLIANLAPAIVHAIALLQCAPNMRAEYSSSGSLNTCVAMLVRTLGGSRGCQGVALPAAGFAVVFPSIAAALAGDDKETLPLQQPALRLMAIHSDPAESRYPRVDMLYLLLQTVLVRAPKPLHKQAESLIKKLFKGIAREDLPRVTQSLLSQHSHVRGACVRGLLESTVLSEQADVDPDVLARLCFARADSDEQNAADAEIAYQTYASAVAVDGCDVLIQMLASSGVPYVRQTVARSVGKIVEDFPQCAYTAVEQLCNMYTDHPDQEFDAPLPPTVTLQNEETDLYPWNIREGVALVFSESCSIVSQDDIGPLFDFFVSRPLGDPNDAVKDAMVAAVLKIVDTHGESSADQIFSILEESLGASDVQDQSELAIQDRARESFVICLGGLAKHLPVETGKPMEIMDNLLAALSTPSEAVQRSIAKCLPPLIKMQKDRAENLLLGTMDTLRTAEGFAERRGAAFGLAGLVKGLGLSSLKAHQIIPKLSAMVDPAINKKDNQQRQGGLWAFECLCVTMGRLFEPYVIHILPLLLACFNSGSSIREAAFSAADAIMSQLSGQGVKLVLPSLLRSIDESDAWRTTVGAIEVLGAMAHCAPRQLSQCLPTVVPRLCLTITETHPKVKAASAASLARIGEVIRNPEVKEIAPSLLKALGDPQHTPEALQKLMDMAFVHAVDAPSLAVIMPTLQRGLRDRITDTKKCACQIVGSMCSLVGEAKDMEPYLPMVLPDLQTMLMDHIPEIRAVSAKALGSLIRGMGEAAFPTLVEDLLNRACPPEGDIDEYGEEKEVATTTIERAGAAQGLSEVIAGLGIERFATLMPLLLERGEDRRAAVREGVLSVFVYMPQACESPEEFEPFIAETLQPVLAGLADEGESVRDIALRAAKVLVEIYGRSALDMLLPALQERLFDDEWRIRHSAVQLLGDLIFKLTGASGKAVMDDDEHGVASSSVGQALITALGEDRRNEVLSSLYVLRSDVSHVVGHAANHVWKSVVVNPPRTLREIMHEMMSMIIEFMASEEETFQVMGGRTMGDLVHKMGDSVLPMVLPILREGIQDEDPMRRQGICLGLAQVISSSTKVMLEAFVVEFIPPLETALMDDDAEVRQAAAQTFSTMFKHADHGRKALDVIIPSLLGEIASGNDFALDGLQQVVTVRSSLVQSLVPKLCATGKTGALSLASIQALSRIAAVPDVALDLYVTSIVPGLLAAFDFTESVAEADVLLETAEEFIVAITVDAEDIDMLINELTKGLKKTLERTPSNAVRTATAQLLKHVYVEGVELSNENDLDIMDELVKLLDHEDQEVRQAMWNTIDTMVKTLGPKGADHALHRFLPVLRSGISRLKEKGRLGNPEWCLAGLSVPKGLDPFVEVYQRALLKGTEDLREEGATGLGELIDVSDQTVLQKKIIVIAGPLIRVFGDKFSWQVKAAILTTFGILIAKAGMKIKQFVPQLQGIFTKALRASSRPVRAKAVSFYAHTHARTHAHTHARTHARTHAHGRVANTNAELPRTEASCQKLYRRCADCCAATITTVVCGKQARPPHQGTQQRPEGWRASPQLRVNCMLRVNS
jgi:HEAT repeat protein